ncbi:MAG: class I SAM-dependent methyltransferase [Gemmatimonadota bacterium]
MLIPLDFSEGYPEVMAELADLFSARRSGWHWPQKRNLYGNEYTWTLARLFERLGPDLSGRTVMDAGGGASALQHYIARRGADVVNVSKSPGQLPGRTETGAAVPRVRCVAADLVDVDLPPASFDAIVSVSAIEHNPWDKIREIVAHLLTLLKPGAPLIVTVPAGKNGKWYPTGTFPGFPKFPNVYLWDHVSLYHLAAWVDQGATVAQPEITYPEGSLSRPFCPGCRGYEDRWDAMKADMDSFPGGHRRPYLSAGFVFERRP